VQAGVFVDSPGINWGSSGAQALSGTKERRISSCRNQCRDADSPTDAMINTRVLREIAVAVEKLDVRVTRVIHRMAVIRLQD